MKEKRNGGEPAPAPPRQSQPGTIRISYPIAVEGVAIPPGTESPVLRPLNGRVMIARKPCSIVVAVDHPIVAEGLLRLLNNHPWLVFEHYVRSVVALRKLIEVAPPDLLVLSLFFNNSAGLELIQEISRRPVAPRILIFSQHEESAYAMRALASGAAGYLMRNRGREEVLDALETVADGRPYLSLEMRLIQNAISDYGENGSARSRNGVSRLSSRELHIFHLLGDRRTTGEIALTLGISAKTVETYYERLKTKLGQRHLRDLCHFADEWRRSVN